MRPGGSQYNAMKLSTRLLLLILGCLVPILVAQVYTLVRQHSDRQARIGDSVLSQAELAMNDLSGVIDGVRRLSRIAARLSSIIVVDPECEDQLASLHRDLPSISFLAVQNRDGTLVCASRPAVEGAWSQRPSWLPELGKQESGWIGRVGSVPGLTHSLQSPPNRHPSTTIT